MKNYKVNYSVLVFPLIRSVRSLHAQYTISMVCKFMDRLWCVHAVHSIEEGTAAVKVLIKHVAIFFIFHSKKFLPMSFKIQLLETSPQKQKEQRKKQLDVSFFWCLFPSCTFWVLCNLLYCLHFAKFVCLLKRLQRLKQEWQKSTAGTRQTYGKN